MITDNEIIMDEEFMRDAKKLSNERRFDECAYHAMIIIKEYCWARRDNCKLCGFYGNGRCFFTESTHPYTWAEETE